MCSDPQKLLSYYSNKINIYDNSSFISLPYWNSCPPPPQLYIVPELVYPPAGPYLSPFIVPIQPPLYYAGTACTTSSITTSCGPCGR